MGWTESRALQSVGTTGDVENAHRVLDEAGIDPGPLAMRALKAGLLVKKFKKEEMQKSAKFYTVDI